VETSEIKGDTWTIPMMNHKIMIDYIFSKGVRGDAVGSSAALQAGRSRVQFPMASLEFFIDIILPAVIWPWG